MDSKISKTGQFGRTVEVSATEEELRPYFDEAFQDFRKKVKLEGFRKGKVPMELIKRMSHADLVYWCSGFYFRRLHRKLHECVYLPVTEVDVGPQSPAIYLSPLQPSHSIL